MLTKKEIENIYKVKKIKVMHRKRKDGDKISKGNFIKAMLKKIEEEEMDTIYKYCQEEILFNSN